MRKALGLGTKQSFILCTDCFFSIERLKNTIRNVRYRVWKKTNTVGKKNTFDFLIKTTRRAEASKKNLRIIRLILVEKAN